MNRIVGVTVIVTSAFDEGMRAQKEYALQQLSVVGVKNRRISAVEEATSQISQMLPPLARRKEIE